MRAVEKAALLTLVTFAAVAPLPAQESVDALAAECAGGVGALEAPCMDMAAAAAAVQGGAGLASGFGAELPGSGSTIGKGLGGGPRLTGALRAGFVRYEVPAAGSSAPAGPESATAKALLGTGTIGIFEGFSFAPTVGGFLSLDVTGTGALLSAGSGEGFSGSTKALALGARMGLLRESFTLPGVTAFAGRRWVGKVRYGNEEGSIARVGVGDHLTEINTLRLTASKDVLGLGALLGVGWDGYESEVEIQAATLGVPNPALGSADDRDFKTSRTLLYGGVSWTVLMLQLSGEAGWASGLADAEPTASGFDLGEGSFFGSVAARLTLN